MDTTIGGLKFEATPIFAVDRMLQTRRGGGAGRDQTVYVWNCKTGKEQYIPRSAGTKGVPVRNILRAKVFHDGMGGVGRFDKAATVRMEMLFLSKSTAARMSDALAGLNRALGIPRVEIPLKKFEKFKELVSFRIMMEPQYEVFELVNKTHSITLHLLVPTRGIFTLEVVDYCSPAGLEALLKAEPGVLDKEVRVHIPGGTKTNRKVRKTAKEAEIESLRPSPDFPMDVNHEERRKLKGELEKLKKEAEAAGD